MSWKAEQGADYEVPGIINFMVKKGILQDQSWHNDASPSFGVEDPEREGRLLRIWVDHPLTSRREVSGKRFTVHEGEGGTEPDFEYSTDDLEQALEKFLVRAFGAEYNLGDSDLVASDDPQETLSYIIEAWEKSLKVR
jgi:hypothetical protein